MIGTASGERSRTQSWITEFDITIRHPSRHQVGGWIYASRIHVWARN